MITNQSGNMKKIYLAIPYSGMEESSFEQATQTTFDLMNNNKNLNVFSPITHSHPLAKLGLSGSWDYWEQLDYQFIDWADEIYVVIPKEGINKIIQSKGVQAEIAYAEKKNKLITYL